MATATATAGVAAPRQRFQFVFSGQGAEYFKIWIVNIFLSIVTLGIYSAWAKVRRNRYFYGNTRLGNAAFEYLADPKAILKGRLIAFGAFAAYSVVNKIWPPAGIAFSLAFAGLVPWLVVRSLAFRARNTSFRNIRFNFNAQYKHAARAFLWLPFLIPITIGLLYPYVVREQKGMVVQYSTYGTTAFHFEAKLGAFYEVFGIPLVLFVGGGFVVWGLVPISTVLAFAVGALLYLTAYAYLSAHLANLIYNHTRLGDYRLHSTLRARDIAMLHVTNLVGIALTFGLFVPWAKVRLAKYRAEHLQLIADGQLDAFVGKEQERVASTGEEMGEMFDVDIAI